jgi:predicted Zn-dependent peptidase
LPIQYTHTRRLKADPFFSSSQLPAGSKDQSSTPSRYVGGDYRVATDSPVTNVVLAFEFVGGWRDTKASTAMTVLNTLMGGGGSFSAGGPGKGMYSKLYRNVLNKHGWAQNCTAFHSVFDDTGVVGISGVADGARAGDMIAVMAQEFGAVAAGKITDEELARAKAATVSSILMNLESKGTALRVSQIHHTYVLSLSLVTDCPYIATYKTLTTFLSKSKPSWRRTSGGRF